jgi:hypothetical protein
LVFAFQLDSPTEIDDFRGQLVVEEDVERLQVAMDDVVIVDWMYP